MFKRLAAITLCSTLICASAFGRELLGYATSKKEFNDTVDGLIAECQRRGEDVPCKLLVTDRKFGNEIVITLPVWPASSKRMLKVCDTIQDDAIPDFKALAECLQDEVYYFVGDHSAGARTLECKAELVYSGNRMTTVHYNRPDCLLGKEEVAEKYVSYHVESGKELELSDLIDPDKEVLLLNKVGALCEARKIKFLEFLGEDVMESLRFHLDDKGLVFRITNPDTGKTDSVCLPDEDFIPLLVPKTQIR